MCFIRERLNGRGCGLTLPPLLGQGPAYDSPESEIAQPGVRLPDVAEPREPRTVRGECSYQVGNSGSEGGLGPMFYTGEDNPTQQSDAGRLSRQSPKIEYVSDFCP